MQTYYSDNLRLSSSAPSGAWGMVGGVSAELGVRSEVTGIGLTPRLREYRYVGPDNVSGYDHTARSVDMKAFHQTETDTWNLGVSYNRDSTLTSELLDSGRVGINIPRQTISLRPSWTSQWTPRTSIQISGGYMKISYSDGLVFGLRNYRVLDARATAEYDWTQRQQLQVTATASRYTAPSFFDDKTDSYTVQGGWVSHWSERTLTSASAGLLVNRSQFSVFGLSLDNTQEGYVLDANVNTRSERTKWSADLSRSIDPTSFGVLMQTDQATVEATRGLSEFVTGTLNGLWMHGKSLHNSFESIDRTLERVTLSVDWRYARHWTLSGRYTWTRQSYGASAARSNAVYLNLAYNGMKYYVSY